MVNESSNGSTGSLGSFLGSSRIISFFSAVVSFDRIRLAFLQTRRLLLLSRGSNSIVLSFLISFGSLDPDVLSRICKFGAGAATLYLVRKDVRSPTTTPGNAVTLLLILFGFREFSTEFSGEFPPFDGDRSSRRNGQRWWRRRRRWRRRR